jgi:hypothetical protein
MAIKSTEKVHKHLPIYIYDNIFYSSHIITDSIQKKLENNLSYISQYYHLQDNFGKGENTP